MKKEFYCGRSGINFNEPVVYTLFDRNMKLVMDGTGYQLARYIKEAGKSQAPDMTIQCHLRSVVDTKGKAYGYSIRTKKINKRYIK